MVIQCDGMIVDGVVVNSKQINHILESCMAIKNTCGKILQQQTKLLKYATIFQN